MNQAHMCLTQGGCSCCVDCVWEGYVHLRKMWLACLGREFVRLDATSVIRILGLWLLWFQQLFVRISRR